MNAAPGTVSVGRPEDLAETERIELAKTATALRGAAGKVLAAYVHPGTSVQHSFLNSLNAVAYWDATHQQRLAQRRLEMRCSSGGLVEARNSIFAAWLDQGTEEWLWMVDTDMGFHGDVVDRLLDAADPTDRPVVGALTFGLKLGGTDGFGGYQSAPFPVMYGWAADEGGQHGFKHVIEYPTDALVRVAGTGAACLLVHRGAAEKLRAEHGDGWFNPVRYPDGRPLSEDLSFCYRLGAADIPVFVATHVKTTHAKQIWLSEEDYLASRALDAIAAAADKASAEAVPEGVKVVRADG